jgi:methionyl-tRNA formyltransferase
VTADVLLLSKTDFWGDQSIALARRVFGERLEAIPCRRGAPFPWRPEDELRYRVVLSFLNAWILPGWFLDRTTVALNFHPAPPAHPGFGPYNFALYGGDTEYGVTCHHIAPRVDTGAIVAVRRFPIYRADSVATLQGRAMVELLSLFAMILDALAADRLPEPSGEAWALAPRRRVEFEALRRVTPDMPADEIERRRRAVTYPGFPGLTTEEMP